jgi:hypothetical protein
MSNYPSCPLTVSSWGQGNFNHNNVSLVPESSPENTDFCPPSNPNYACYYSTAMLRNVGVYYTTGPIGNPAAVADAFNAPTTMYLDNSLSADNHNCVYKDKSGTVKLLNYNQI